MDKMKRGEASKLTSKALKRLADITTRLSCGLPQFITAEQATSGASTVTAARILILSIVGLDAGLPRLAGLAPIRLSCRCLAEIPTLPSPNWALAADALSVLEQIHASAASANGGVYDFLQYLHLYFGGWVSAFTLLSRKTT